MNFVPCMAWVKRGVAASNPEKVVLTPEELEVVIKEAQSKLQDQEDSDADTEDDTKPNELKEITMGDSSKADEYDFDKYDDEEDNLNWNIGSLVSLKKDVANAATETEEDEDEDWEKEDDIIKPDDNLILMGHVEGDASVLEVFVYNESEGSFYCHHDILLPSFPLCIEWLNYDPTDTKPGNYCAIGSMSPIIEVWDLDIMHCLEPAYRLGCNANKKKKQKRVGHTDAVLDITWNKNYTHVLASGSVDETVLLWDLENCTPVTTLDSFNEKVQALDWHPKEPHHLLTGCADKMVRLFDCRQKSSRRQWQLGGEIERVLWNHFKLNYCFASTDNGDIACIDIRKNEPLWTNHAHEQEVTGLSLSSACPNLLVTSSNDSVIKAWDITKKKGPACVWEKKSNLGAIQCLASSPDNPFVFSAGGDSKNHNYRVIDFSGVSEVYDKFKDATDVTAENDDDEATNTHEESGPLEMMDVTEDMESMQLNMNSSATSH